MQSVLIFIKNTEAIRIFSCDSWNYLHTTRNPGILYKQVYYPEIYFENVWKIVVIHNK